MKIYKNRTYYSTTLLLFISIFLMAGCGRQSPPEKQVDPSSYKKPLLEANKHVVKTEKQHIEDFLRRYKWDMTETGSGLRHMVYKEGNGPRAAVGKTATIYYTVRLITGDVVYSSAESGPMTFLIGKAEVISGLEEGILLLNVGEKAKFIIPSHLAYGLLGDENKIPGKATLIYDIELIELN